MNKVPTEAELAAAPLLQGWVLESPSNSRPWLYGWFFGHPEIDDGDHGHTSPVLQMDTGSPAHWATTENRLYRLGVSYPPRSAKSAIGRKSCADDVSCHLAKRLVAATTLRK